MPKSTNTADEYEVVDHTDTALSPEVLARIREWLEPTDYLADSGEFRRHLLSQAPGTGIWICETEEYKKWHDSPDHGSLWIKGVPGAGKSVTAASIIQHLRATEDCPVLFFFFRNIVAANFSPRALIQDWLAQLLPHSPKLQFALQSRLDTNLAEVSDNDLIQLFLDGISCVPKLYCVGDALDEMTTENRPFLDLLNRLATYRPRSLKLLMTSRPKQYLQSALRDSSIVHISLQQQLVDRDIMSYLNHRFDIAPKSAIQQEGRQQIINMVAERSQGLFLYAKLTMDQVEASLLSDTPVDIALLEESLPVGLEQIYTSVLAKQRTEHGITTEVQVLVLEAVTHASRPLRLYELASLIQCVYPNVPAPQGFKTLIATCCGPLVEILEDETLQVIHHSFTEFLRGDGRKVQTEADSHELPIINSKKAHKRMAIHSLQYLQSGSLLLEDERSGNLVVKPSVTYIQPRHKFDTREESHRHSMGIKTERDAFNYREARLIHPFLGYAVQNWSYHASHYDEQDEEIFAAITEFLNPDSLAFRRWLVLQWGSTSKTRESNEGIPTALHIAAFAGLSELTSRLVEQGSSVSALDAQERIPLHWAAANGHAKVASLLIQNGSDPNCEDGRGLKPIHLAAKKNHASVVTTLLEAGVEPDTIKTKEDHAGYLLGGETMTKGECAILYASQGGHTETVVAMIPFCKPDILVQLLCECCRFGRTDAVLAILGHSTISADATYRGGTALYFACGVVNVKCVEALIDRGADVSKTSEHEPRRSRCGGSFQKGTLTAPIHRIVSAWNSDNHSQCLAIFRMLIKAGADLEQRDGLGNTPLLLAAGASGSRGGRGSIHIPALQALLEAGSDAKQTHENGDTPLHLVLSLYRDPEAVQLLIEHGSDPNQLGFRGVSALHASLIQTGMIRGLENTEKIVNYLLDHGADPNLADKHGYTAVHHAMKAGVNVFKLLLSRCNDESVKQRCWFMLTSVRTIGEFTTFLEILLAEGIQIDSRNKQGRTLYLCSLSYRDRLDVLREHGASTDVVDSKGNNALHILCQSGIKREMLEKFIADGVDPLVKNDNGDTPLHHLASRYNKERQMAEDVRWLVSLGIPVNAVNHQGSTAMHLSQKSTNSYGSFHCDLEEVHFVDAINGRKEIDFEIGDKNGLTALHKAVMWSGLEVETLVAAGADLSFLTPDSQNVLHLACRARKPDIVCQILSRLGSLDLNQKDDFGRTPLHYACASGEAESVALLLKHGADAHAVDLASRSCLHACAEFKTEQCLWNIHTQKHQGLRGPPADPFRPDASRSINSYYEEPWYQRQYGESKSGMHRSFFPQIVTIVELLLDEDVDPASTDKSKRTALQIALDVGCVEVIEAFAADDDLVCKATKNLEKNHKDTGVVEEKRQQIKTRMALTRPRSALPMLGQDESTYAQALKHSFQYLDLVTFEDAVKLTGDAFAANPDDILHYCLLENLMKPSQLRLAESASQLVLHFSSYETLKDKLAPPERPWRDDQHTVYWTALQLACQWSEPNLLMLQLLVEKLHVDVNAQSMAFKKMYLKNETKIDVSLGETALHVVASADHWWQIEATKYLIANGAAINAQDEYGQTPLHIAASGLRRDRDATRGFRGFWRLHVVRLLLAHGADPNLLDNKGFSPLHNASNAPDIMVELLRSGANTTLGDRSPLFMAIRDQNLAALEVLLDHGVSVDSVDEKIHSRHVHYTLTESRKVYAVLCAAFAQKLNSRVLNSAPLLRVLIERGANLYAPLNEKETLLHFLFEYPDYDAITTLLEESCASRIDFDSRDQQGRTVLMAACGMRQTLPRSEHLVAPPLRVLDCGANASLVDNEGKTALHHLLQNDGISDEILAKFINRDEVKSTLLVKDNAGFTPLHYALRSLRPEICNLLLSKGANLLEADPNGLTALHYIAKKCLQRDRAVAFPGRINVTLLEDYFEQCLALWDRFIAKGGLLNVPDNDGNTPLLTYLSSCIHRSSLTRTCHVDHYDKLFPSNSGVDVFAVNNDGETALHVITRREDQYGQDKEHDKALFQFMMAKGLDPLKEDAKGRSALDVASACEKTDILNLLGRK